MVSERARIFGCDKPVVGDIVLVDSGKKQSYRPSNNVGRRDPANVMLISAIYVFLLIISFIINIAKGSQSAH